MSLDYNKHGDEDNFLATIREKNPYFYPTGYTGYEQYYIDINGFWRDLYDISNNPSYAITTVSAASFRDLAKYGNLYYDAPVYTQV